VTQLLGINWLNSFPSFPHGLINRAVREGVAQLNRYSISPELIAMPNLKRWVLVFSGDKCVAIYEM